MQPICLRHAEVPGSFSCEGTATPVQPAPGGARGAPVATSLDRILRTALAGLVLHAGLALQGCDTGDDAPAAAQPAEAPAAASAALDPPSVDAGRPATAADAPAAADAIADIATEVSPIAAAAAAAADRPLAGAAPLRAPARQPAIELRLKSFSFVPAAGRGDQFFDLFVLQVEVHNRSEHAIADLRGRIRIASQRRDGHKSVPLHARDGIAASGRSVQTLRIHYNPFADWDRVLKTLTTDDLRLHWQTEYCQFVDGSRWRQQT